MEEYRRILYTVPETWEKRPLLRGGGEEYERQETIV